MRFFPHLIFFVACFALLFFFRNPSINYPDILNPDEAQFAANAVTAVESPMPYTRWDPTSSGPLNIYPLVWPKFFDHPITIQTGRVTAVFALALTATFIFFTLNYSGGWAAASSASGFFLLFCIFSFSPDFTHYSSELIPNTLFALGVFCAFKGLIGEGRKFLLIAAGILLSAAPLAKWQAAPIAILLFFIISFFIFFNKKYFLFLHLTTGMFLPALLLLAVILMTNNLEYFFNAVIYASVGYSGQATQNVFGRIDLVVDLIKSNPEIHAFLLSIIIFLVLIFICFLLLSNSQKKRTLSKNEIKSATQTKFNTVFLLSLSSVWMLGAFLTLLTTGRDFPHYLVFIVPPVGLFSGVAARFVLLTIFSTKSVNLITTMAFLFSSLPFFALCNPLQSPFAETPKFAPPTQTAQLLISVSNKSDRLAVWGWMHEIHSQSKIGYAFPTHSLHNIDFFPPNLHSWLKNSYLKNLSREKPEWFFESLGASVEMTASIPIEKKSVSYQNEIADFIKENYNFFAETDEGRLYSRKDITEMRRPKIPANKSYFGALRNSISIPPGQFRRYATEDGWYLALPEKVPLIIPVPDGADEFIITAAPPPKFLRWNVRWLHLDSQAVNLCAYKFDDNRNVGLFFAQRTSAVGKIQFRVSIPENTGQILLVAEPDSPQTNMFKFIGLGEMEFFQNGTLIESRFPSLYLSSSNSL
jgi:hypothetical protein